MASSNNAKQGKTITIIGAVSTFTGILMNGYGGGSGNQDLKTQGMFLMGIGVLGAIGGTLIGKMKD